jgi:predicted amino acid dehydrogenase
MLKELHESGDGFVSISSDMRKLKDCTVIVSATSASQPVIFAEHLSEKVQVICDIATPKDVAADVRPSWPHIQVISGGLARLPNRPGLQLMGTRLPVDHVYGCVAETTLLGITNHSGHFSFGEMHKDQVKHIARIGKQRGYNMAALKAEDVHGG